MLDEKSTKTTDSCTVRTLFSRNTGFTIVAKKRSSSFQGFVVTDAKFKLTKNSSTK